jgi:hypothetical protein
MSATSNWKNTERMWPKMLGKFGVEAKRISRAGNFAESIHDTIVYKFPELKCDTKFSIKPWKQSNMLEIVRTKYCQDKNQIPLLYCRQFKDRGGKVVIDDDFAAMLIAHWLQVLPKEELWDIYTGKKKPAADDSLGESDE